MNQEVMNTLVDMSQEIIKLKDQKRELLGALKSVTERYVSLVNSGDAGNWNPEEENEIQVARAAISKAESEQ